LKICLGVALVVGAADVDLKQVRPTGRSIAVNAEQVLPAGRSAAVRV
jgi:hypothetical protein